MRALALWLGIASSVPSGAHAQGVSVSGTVSIPNARPDEAVVYLVPAELEHRAPVPDTVDIDQHNLRFVPRTVVGVPGTTVRFLNSDPVFHNIFHPGGDEPAFDLGTYPAGESRAHTFTALGGHVILCHIHPEMLAYVVIVPTPLHATTDARGAFVLEDVPPGTYQVHVWHRRARPFVQDLAVGATGRRDLTFRLERR